MPAGCESDAVKGIDFSDIQLFVEDNWGWFAGGAAGLVALAAAGGGGGGSSSKSAPNPDPNPGPDPDPNPGPDPDPNPGPDPDPVKPDTVFGNGVVYSEHNKTLAFNGVTYSYVTVEGGWLLTPVTAGKGITPQDVLFLTKFTVNTNVTPNTVTLEGTYGDAGYFWRFDNDGKLIAADENTRITEGDGQVITTGPVVVTEPGGVGNLIKGDGNTLNITGDLAAGEGGTGVLITGVDGKIEIDGNLTVTGDGTGNLILGDGAVITVTGDGNITGPGSTGNLIEGDGATVTITGSITTDGGTGTHIIGDDAKIVTDG
ncbi:putative surface-exposed virulence protein, partial [Pantoea sesami]